MSFLDDLTNNQLRVCRGGGGESLPQTSGIIFHMIATPLSVVLAASPSGTPGPIQSLVLNYYVLSSSNWSRTQLSREKRTKNKLTHFMLH